MIQEIKATFAGQEAEGIIAGIMKKFANDKHLGEDDNQEEEKEGGRSEELKRWDYLSNNKFVHVDGDIALVKFQVCN